MDEMLDCPLGHNRLGNKQQEVQMQMQMQVRVQP
jgi:hypothetical protein